MKRESVSRAAFNSVILKQFRHAVLTVSPLLFAFISPAQTLHPTNDAARAILEHSCFGCHGQAKVSGLDLRQRETLLRGGKRGPAVIPGNADASLLYRAVIQDGDVKMPPGGTPLTKAEVDTLRQWIQEGAVWDQGVKSAESMWWSFRRPKRPPVPVIKASS